MKTLDIDLDLLIQSFSFNEDDLGKEYLDTQTGDIINIPCEVNKVVCGNKEEEDLEEWERSLLEDACNIKENKEDRYIVIPCIKDAYFHNVMVDFAKEKVSSEELKEKLLDALNNGQSIRNFKNIIYQYEEELDNWQDYEYEKLKEYVVIWLNNIGINLK